MLLRPLACQSPWRQTATASLLAGRQPSRIFPASPVLDAVMRAASTSTRTTLPPSALPPTPSRNGHIPLLRPIWQLQAAYRVPIITRLCQQRFRSTDTKRPPEKEEPPKPTDFMDSAPPKFTSSSSTNARLTLLFIISSAIAGGGALAIFSFIQPLFNEGSSTGQQDDDMRDFARTIEDMESEHPNGAVRFWHGLFNALNDYIVEPIGTVKRFLVLFALFFPVLLTMPMLLVGRKGGSRSIKRKASDGADYVTIDEESRWGAIWWYEFLVKQMERAGPTFIKLAQWAGSRQDLFPSSLCERLGKLHSNGKPHSLRYTKRVIERVFGRPFDDIFEEFGETPLGIGAVAQVYKAKLRPDVIPPDQSPQRRLKNSKRRGSSTTTKTTTATQDESNVAADSADQQSNPTDVPTASVAIKILHPKVHRTIARDIRIMTFFAKLINTLPGAEWLSFPEEVEVFSGMMFSQLDLRNEAKNLLRFEDNFSQRPDPISFPRPLAKFSTKELLIEQYEDAVPLKHFLRNGGAGFDHRIATLGLDTFLYMLLLDNFTHADLHPGNIMIKFFHPTRSNQIHAFFSRLLAPFNSDYRVGGPKGPQTADQQAEENVVAKLKSLKHDENAWNEELERLDALGYQPELVLLDAGLTVELSPKNRRNFLDLFSAVAEFNGELAGNLMVERCRTPDLVIDKEGFAMKIQRLILSVKSKTFSLAQIKISDVLNEVLMAVRDHHVKMEADFVNTVISILLLEGIGRRLDPSMDVSVRDSTATVMILTDFCFVSFCSSLDVFLPALQIVTSYPAIAGSSNRTSRGCSRPAHARPPPDQRPVSDAQGLDLARGQVMARLAGGHRDDARNVRLCLTASLSCNIDSCLILFVFRYRHRNLLHPGKWTALCCGLSGGGRGDGKSIVRLPFKDP